MGRTHDSISPWYEIRTTNRAGGIVVEHQVETVSQSDRGPACPKDANHHGFDYVAVRPGRHRCVNRIAAQGKHLQNLIRRFSLRTDAYCIGKLSHGQVKGTWILGLGDRRGNATLLLDPWARLRLTGEFESKDGAPSRSIDCPDSACMCRHDLTADG